MAKGAPDWERIVSIIAQVPMGKGAPDWERIVVGPGGSPIGGTGPVFQQVEVTATDSEAPGNYCRVNIGNAPASGTMVLWCPIAFSVATAGTYAVSGWCEIYGGPGTMAESPVSATLTLPVSMAYLPNYLPWVGYATGVTIGTQVRAVLCVQAGPGNVTLGSPYELFLGGGMWPLYAVFS